MTEPQDPRRCRELSRKARHWARETGNESDRRLARKLEREFEALGRRLERGKANRGH